MRFSLFLLCFGHLSVRDSSSDINLQSNDERFTINGTLFVAWLSISCQALSNGQLCEFVINLSSAKATVSFAAACISAQENTKFLFEKKGNWCIQLHLDFTLSDRMNNKSYHLPDEIRRRLFGIQCVPAGLFQHSHNTVAIFRCSCQAFLSEVWDVALTHCTVCWTLNLLPTIVKKMTIFHFGKLKCFQRLILKWFRAARALSFIWQK